MEPGRLFHLFFTNGPGMTRAVYLREEKGVRHVYRFVFTPAFLRSAQVGWLHTHECRAHHNHACGTRG